CRKNAPSVGADRAKTRPNQSALQYSACLHLAGISFRTQNIILRIMTFCGMVVNAFFLGF
ncbi:MAG: hypothetical protein IJB22_07095, partial [Clostridia bacterium]|nr:hypothetical protein [Clostridia bacterium]